MDDECPICLQALTGAAEATTACAHRFHTACILRAVRCSTACPVCRATLVPPPRALPAYLTPHGPEPPHDGLARGRLACVIAEIEQRARAAEARRHPAAGAR
jgi:hypothetical protein